MDERGKGCCAIGESSPQDGLSAVTAVTSGRSRQEGREPRNENHGGAEPGPKLPSGFDSPTLARRRVV